jgi:hypothetical protein
VKPKGEGKTIKNATFSAELQRVSRKFRIFAPINDKTTANMATDKVAYWLDIANYDLDTAEALYNSGRWLYVAFMCHQVIEKTLKARYPDSFYEDGTRLDFENKHVLQAFQNALKYMKRIYIK